MLQLFCHLALCQQSGVLPTVLCAFVHDSLVPLDCIYQRESELWDRNVFVVGWGKECCNNTVGMRGRWDSHQVGHQNRSIPRVNIEREVVNVLHP